MSEGGFDAGKALSSATTSIEKVSETSFFMLIASAFFLLDTCLVLFHNKNILSFSREDISIANIVIFITLLSFLISVFFPFARILLTHNDLTRYLYSHVYIPIIKWWYEYDSSYPEYSYDFLTAEIIAIRHKDEFTLKRIEKRRDAVRTIRDTYDKAFSFGYLLFINIFLVDSDDILSINQSLQSFLWQENIFVCCIYWLSICILLLLSIWTLSPRRDDIIYYPPEIEKKPAPTGTPPPDHFR